MKGPIEPKIGPWKHNEIGHVPKHGHNVLSCFHGVGATMGYELAGFSVLGVLEPDKRMMEMHKQNHFPTHAFEMDAGEFVALPDFPQDLYGIDILDGLLPCGFLKRRKRSIDSPFSHFISMVKKLQPKVVVAEADNAIVRGNARGYVKEILNGLGDYDTQVFELNSCRMGCPQKRQRVFFISRHRALNLVPIRFEFKEPIISVMDAWADLEDQKRKSLVWKKSKGKRLAWDGPSDTITHTGKLFHPMADRPLRDIEFVRLQTFPDDYNFGQNPVQYVCGMSVPPYMMQRIALELFWQWFGARL